MFRPILGYIFFLAVSLAFCNKSAIKQRQNWSIVLYGVILQVVLVFAMINIPAVISFFECMANGIMKLKDATIEGTRFVFGYLGGGDPPFQVKEGSSAYILGFQALPTVILFCILSSVLTYLKILPFLSKGVGYIFKVVFKVRESIGMVAAARIFVGQFEAPLLIKHELDTLKKSDLFIILALSFTTASAAVMPIYAGALEGICPNAMRHVIMSSVVSVISALIICSIMAPSEESGATNALPTDANSSRPYTSFMGALSKGLSDGCFVWWCIVGSMIGMVALIAFVNCILAQFPSIGGSPLTLQSIFGLIMYPFAWLIGIESADLFAVSQVLGTKLAVNEVVAYFDLAKANISQESVVKTIYAITNFGNFSCIGITVGGMAALAPAQKDIPVLIGKAFVAALLATGLSSTIISIFFSF